MNREFIAGELLKVVRDLVSYDDIDLRSDMNISHNKIKELEDTKYDLNRAWSSWDYDALEESGVLASRLRREIERMDNEDSTGGLSVDLVQVLVNNIQDRLRSLDMLITYEKRHLKDLGRVKISSKVVDIGDLKKALSSKFTYLPSESSRSWAKFAYKGKAGFGTPVKNALRAAELLFRVGGFKGTRSAWGVGYDDGSDYVELEVYLPDMKTAAENQIARELVKIASDLRLADGYSGFEEFKNVIEPDLRPLASAVKKVVSKLESEFGGKYKIWSGPYRFPVPGAHVEVKNQKNSRLLTVASMWRMGKGSYSKLAAPEFFGYYVKIFNPARGDANPFWEKTFKKRPTASVIMGELMKARKSVGDEKFYQMLGVDPVDTGSDTPTTEKIQDVIGRTWFDLEETGPDSLMYATRDNGDVGDEEVGREDISEAVRIRKDLLKTFGSKNLEVSIEPVDEWVYLSIRIK